MMLFCSIRCLMNPGLGNPYCGKPISGTYEILNLYSVNGSLQWNFKGDISQKRKVDLDHLRWTGNTYEAPEMGIAARRHLKVAIAAIEPFLILKQPGADRRVSSCVN